MDLWGKPYPCRCCSLILLAHNPQGENCVLHGALLWADSVIIHCNGSVFSYAILIRNDFRFHGIDARGGVRQE